MKKNLIHSALLIAITGVIVAGNIFSGCQETPSTSSRPNQSPETHLWVDTIGSVQTSQVTLHWWGDDPDGFIRGYLITVDGISWGFTAANESTFVISVGSNILDTARIQIAAVDQEGNGGYDHVVVHNGISFGGEAFEDNDSNGVYTVGEPYVDYGAIDPTPARISVLVKNTPPVVTFDALSTVPSKTLPVATVLFTGTDIDGNSTIREYFIAMNDTADTSWTKIPNTVSMLTLVGDLTDTSATTVPAVLKSGIAADDIGISVNNLKLNSNNAMYLYAVDITGAKSKIVRMPDTTKTWFVQKPRGRRKLLLVDDYGTANPNPDLIYKDVFDSTLNSQGVSYKDYDVLDINGQPISVNVAAPMILETMKLYPMVFWYSKIANLRYAQETIPQYLLNNGKAIFTTGFDNFITSSDELAIDFAPVDSLLTSYKVNDSTINGGYIPRVYLNSKVLPVDSNDANPHPVLLFDRTAIFGTYAAQEGSLDKVLYRLDLPKPANSQELWVGNPAVGIQSNNGRLIFFTVPLHLMRTYDPLDNNKSRLIKLFERIFKGDFGE